MSQPEKESTSGVHEKHEAALSPSRGPEQGQDAHSGIDEKALLRKLDVKLLPALTLLYFLSFLDRSNGTLPHP